MKSNLIFCLKCGAELAPNDRYCGDCGFDTQQILETPAEQGRPESHSVAEPQIAADNVDNLGSKSDGNKKLFVIVIALLALLLSAGGLYWWLTRGNEPGTGNKLPAQADQNVGIVNSTGQQAVSDTAEFDLTRASTYLSEPGIKCTFAVNYPDGTAGIVERFSGQAVPNEAVLVSEVETGVDQGVDFGYGFHYVERADGTYYILDQTPNEIMPVIKNNLTVGQTWNYQNESGQIIWTVLDIGVDLDLGFAVFEDCLLVKEDNQMAEFQSITYYAPGRGSVLVMNPSGSIAYYKMTALEQINLAQAAKTIINWCPNYYDIGDDRTQSY